MQIKYELDEGACAPMRAHDSDAGSDLLCIQSCDYVFFINEDDRLQRQSLRCVPLLKKSLHCSG